MKSLINETLLKIKPNEPGWNQSRNRIPEHVKSVHLIGACGTGMGALACLLKDMGYAVTGSDQKVYPPMSDFLSSRKIVVADGFSEKNLSHSPDVVVVGNTVRRQNPEALEIDRQGLFFCSMPQAVNHFVATGKKPIVVAGTHGKTTTSAMMAWVLYRADLDPSFMIGGVLKYFDSNCRLGSGEHIVIEGDEYDTAFFDKGPKFLHYAPDVAIVTSVEFDHADIFADMDHVVSAFDAFISKISGAGVLFAFDENEPIDRLVENRDCAVLRYGMKERSDWRVGEISAGGGQSLFSVFKQGRRFDRYAVGFVGRHNIFNALSVIAAADKIKIPKAIIKQALETFQGVKRRQEIRGVKRGVMVMDDFAHHPTAVKETIGGVKSFYPDRRLVAVFEPRTNSSRRNVFQKVYPLSFDDADMVCVRRPPLIETVPLDQRFSSSRLVSDLKQRGKEAFYFPDTEKIIDFISETARPGDIVLVMSNGGFDRIHERLLKRL